MEERYEATIAEPWNFIDLESEILPESNAEFCPVEENQAIFRCPIPGCDYENLDQRYLAVHSYMIHEDEQPETDAEFFPTKAERRKRKAREVFHCPIPGCGYKNSNKRYLVVHSKIHKPEQSEYHTYTDQPIRIIVSKID